MILSKLRTSELGARQLPIYNSSLESHEQETDKE